MTVPETYSDTCLRAAELASQGRYFEAFDLHHRYRIKAADRGDPGWSLPDDERVRRQLNREAADAQRD